MMNEIKKDVVYLIASKLDPLDIYKWAIAHKRIGKILKPIFYSTLINKIDQKLRSHFEKTKGITKKSGVVPLETDEETVHPTIGSYDEFVQAMISSQGVISGSFILQMINGEIYKGSDIDIYTQQNRSSHSDLKWMNVNDLEVLLWTNHEDHWVSSGIYSDGKISLVREYSISGREPDPGECRTPRRVTSLSNFSKFQVITLNISPKEFIMENFDFSILKNLFWYDENGPHIEVTDLKGIMTKIVHFDKESYLGKVSKGLTEKLSERIKKYEERGFTFICN